MDLLGRGDFFRPGGGQKAFEHLRGLSDRRAIVADVLGGMAFDERGEDFSAARNRLPPGPRERACRGRTRIDGGSDDSSTRLLSTALTSGPSPGDEDVPARCDIVDAACPTVARRTSAAGSIPRRESEPNTAAIDPSSVSAISRVFSSMVFKRRWIGSNVLSLSQQFRLHGDDFDRIALFERLIPGKRSKCRASSCIHSPLAANLDSFSSLRLERSLRRFSARRCRPRGSNNRRPGWRPRRASGRSRRGLPRFRPA